MSRKRRRARRRIKKVVTAVGIGCLGSTTASAATTLTGLIETNIEVPADHGSNLSGTPNVAVNWSGARWDQYDGWPNDPGDGVYQVDGVGDGTVTHTVEFMPQAGWNVKLSSLDLNVWGGGGDTDVDWSADGLSSGNLGSGTFSTADGTAMTHAIDLTGTDGENVVLSLTQASGIGSYLAMDNLAFDQVLVPEPSSLATALAGLGGLGALAIRRKRKK